MTKSIEAFHAKNAKEQRPQLIAIAALLRTLSATIIKSDIITSYIIDIA
jgi:hypothetical protein